MAQDHAKAIHGHVAKAKAHIANANDSLQQITELLSAMKQGGAQADAAQAPSGMSPLGGMAKANG